MAREALEEEESGETQPFGEFF